MTSRLMNLKNDFQENWKGLLSIFGAFLLQLCVGSFHGTFGNLLPYITSYLRQVNMSTYNSSESILIKGLFFYEIMTNNALQCLSISENPNQF